MRFAIDLGVGVAALVNLLCFARAGEATRLVLAAVVIAVAGAPAARRAVALLRRGVLDRDALAWVAIAACFATGVVDLLVARPSFTAPEWLQALGVRPVPGQPARGAGFEAAAVIAVATLAGRVAEAALHRRVLRDILVRVRERQRTRAASSPPDVGAVLDAEVLVSLGLPAGADDAGTHFAGWAPGPPAPDTWEDAVVRGFFTAALGLATFALVTRGLLGAGLLGRGALFAGAAVLAVVSPSSVLVAAPAARAIAVVRARAAGVVVKNPAALEALAGVDAACLERNDAIAGVLPGSVAAPIVITEGRLDDLPWLFDLGRALRSAIRQNVALGALFNAALVPAAALGYVSPLGAALAALAETLLGLLNVGRLLRWPARRSGEEGSAAKRVRAPRGV